MQPNWIRHIKHFERTIRLSRTVLWHSLIYRASAICSITSFAQNFPELISKRSLTSVPANFVVELGFPRLLEMFCTRSEMQGSTRTLRRGFMNHVRTLWYQRHEERDTYTRSHTRAHNTQRKHTRTHTHTYLYRATNTHTLFQLTEVHNYRRAPGETGEREFSYASTDRFVHVCVFTITTFNCRLKEQFGGKKKWNGEANEKRTEIIETE